jgi:hypothetical protein
MLLLHGDTADIADHAEGLKQPQANHHNDDDIDDGLYGSRHGDEVIDCPQGDADDDQDDDDLNEGHGASNQDTGLDTSVSWEGMGPTRPSPWGITLPPLGDVGQREAWTLASAWARRGLLNGQLHAALDDAGGDGVAGEAGGVVDVELAHEMVPVLLDGLDADAEFRRDLLVGLPRRSVGAPPSRVNSD